ncbi:hypothetical protein [uncultured Chryseobacterium sp.]|uniref:hypothetical protein n=1 Tax=uncultured Chryseobacterium sp. TaxID=259322 RepID=UPI0025EB32D1|nr:hypothetical protein [uncultured Chryseobacterium sp.]
MSNVLAGIFNYGNDYKNLEADLEQSGFDNSDYIVYLNEGSHAPQLVSVAVRDAAQAEHAGSIFSSHGALKTYLIDNMSIHQADYQTVKRFIDSHNRAEIHNSPDVKIKGATDGMDSEVRF